ncbi:MAG: hypothetical protein CME65_10915 [Halobacteriovoraceae bacterium]|nr:hypothetical protein [Halobacteriovoraceae bacterium]|tara:strand:- start:42 stop:257 length:216 start_codon:yes stop_codon:yes gene_type:complete
MTWQKESDPKKFLKRFENQLSEYEPENCLLLSLLQRLSKNPKIFGPTSNSIYKKIGYNPVIDMDVIKFSQS